MEKHIGIVKVNENEILEWLQLEGGCIKGVTHSWEDNSIRFGIEHPEMPLVREGEVLRVMGLAFEELPSGEIKRLPITREY